MRKADNKMPVNSWGDFVNRAFFALASGAIVIATTKIATMSDSIVDLNTKLSVLITDVANQKTALLDQKDELKAQAHIIINHEGRIQTLEMH